MSHGKFTTGYLPAVGDITVTGPFDPDDGEVNFARIIFLVVQVSSGPGNGSGHRGREGRGSSGRGMKAAKDRVARNRPAHGDLALGPSDDELRWSPAG